jgi:hypothetical protein
VRGSDSPSANTPLQRHDALVDYLVPACWFFYSVHYHGDKSAEIGKQNARCLACL